jgi:hypothetical protein
MGNRTKFILLVAAILACSTANAKKPPPPPQFVIVRKLPPEAVLQRMQAACVQNGMSILSVAPTQLTCTKPMDDSMRSMFIRALVTPSYSTNPVYHYQVNAIRVGDNTTISMQEFVQYQNAFGQITNIPITNRKELTTIGTSLQNMKTTWEARLAANGDDEVAALAASNAAMNGGSGPPPSSTSAPPPPVSPVSSSGRGLEAAAVEANPSAQAAKQALTQLGCADSIRIVGDSGGKTLFEGHCRAGGTQLVQCSGMACKGLR